MATERQEQQPRVRKGWELLGADPMLTYTVLLYRKPNGRYVTKEIKGSWRLEAGELVRESWS